MQQKKEAPSKCCPFPNSKPTSATITVTAQPHTAIIGSGTQAHDTHCLVYFQCLETREAHELQIVFWQPYRSAPPRKGIVLNLTR